MESLRGGDDDEWKDEHTLFRSLLMFPGERMILVYCCFDWQRTLASVQYASGCSRSLLTAILCERGDGSLYYRFDRRTPPPGIFFPFLHLLSGDATRVLSSSLPATTGERGSFLPSPWVCVWGRGLCMSDGKRLNASCGHHTSIQKVGSPLASTPWLPVLSR